MAGLKTSVYLAEDLAEAVKADGRPLAELIRAGLTASEPDPPVTRSELHAELAPVLAAIKASGKTARAPAETECKHPGVRPKNRCPECHQYNV